MKPTLIAGDKNIHDFCIEIFQNPEPIIMIWSTEDKPNFSEEDENACQVQLVDEINLFFKDMIHSFFFPNGFVVKEWNLVLVTIKDEFATQVRHSNDGLIRGWLMGTDFESQMMIGSKILVKMP